MVTTERSWSIKDADDNILNVFEGEANNDFIGQTWADGVLISSVEQLPDVTIEIDEPSAYDLLREDRNKALVASDWTQVADAPVDQAAWATYRQQLRDLPNNTEDPANPAWPTKPE